MESLARLEDVVDLAGRRFCVDSPADHGKPRMGAVIRRSSAVHDGIVEQCLTIAERLDCRGSVRIRRTSDVASPCLAGLWRPILLLPERDGELIGPDELRAILAHELAHARNHDLAWNLVAHFASILLWFHPLAWKIRVVHAAACDVVCDAVAVDLLGDVDSYGRTLARLAVRAAWPSSAHGLAMARTCDVRRRLDALNRKVFQTPLSWRHVMPALLLVGAMLVMMGGFGFTRAEQAASHRDRPGKSVQLPASKELRLQPGTVIGGIVKDEAGKPSAGATIIRSMSLTEWDGSWVDWRFDGPQTDAQGRWRMDDAPANLADVYMEVVHPNYHTGGGPASRNLDSVFVLKKGYTVRGRVVDASSLPVRGAKAVIGRSYSDGDMQAATTNASGEFAVERCAEGPNIVTVQADGLAPDLREVQIGERLEPIAFRLQPGSELYLRVVDIQGKPVAGAFVFPQTWREYHSIELRRETDSEGRLTWRGAAPDTVLYDVGKTGFMSCRALPLIASDREHLVTLRPELVIAGRATDSVTGQPIPKCSIIKGVGFVGNDHIAWFRASAMHVSGGEYTTSFDEPNYAMYVRVEATGYKPAVSRAFRPEEGRQRFDIALERAETLSGIVQLPDGKPADGVDIVLATEDDQVFFQGGHLENRTSALRSKTSSDGRFSFTAPKGNFLLVAVGDAGYTDASPEKLANADKLILQPWGRLEGQVMVGRRPNVNAEITFSPSQRSGGFTRRIFFHQYDTKTDDQGHFVFDRVIPGRGLVTRSIVTNFGRFSQRLTCGGTRSICNPVARPKCRSAARGGP